MARTVGDPVITAITFFSILGGLYGIFLILSLPLPPHLINGGHWQFLTNLSLVYSLCVFLIGFLAHVSRSEKLFEVKNNLHPIGLALEAVVACVYWPLRIFFLHLLVAEPEKMSLPLVTDLCIHLLPVVSLLVDYLIFMPRWTLTATSALSMCAVLATAYYFLLKKLVDVESGASYPYMFLNTEKESTRIMIFGLVAFVGFSQFIFMRMLYDWIVGSSDEEIEAKKIE